MALLIVILSCYLLVPVNARGKTFNDVQDIPFDEVGLLLGTSPVTSNGEHNYYFDPLLPMVSITTTLTKE